MPEAETACQKCGEGLGVPEVGTSIGQPTGSEVVPDISKAVY